MVRKTMIVLATVAALTEGLTFEALAHGGGGAHFGGGHFGSAEVSRGFGGRSAGSHFAGRHGGLDRGRGFAVVPGYGYDLYPGYGYGYGYGCSYSYPNYDGYSCYAPVY